MRLKYRVDPIEEESREQGEEEEAFRGVERSVELSLHFSKSSRELTATQLPYSHQARRMDQQRPSSDDSRHQLLMVGERSEGGVDGTADGEGGLNKAEKDVIGPREDVGAVDSRGGSAGSARRGIE
jgi:hypothetical protein